MHTLIIGAGAAGIAAAIAAAENGSKVTVLERNRRPLKKLGVTGNGRGNLLNSGELRYYGDTAFALEVMTHMPYAHVRDFLEGLGITLVQEGDLVYPAALLASVAVDALLERAARLGIDIQLSTSVISAKKAGGIFHVSAVQSRYEADRPKTSGKMKKGALLEEKAISFEADQLVITVGGAATPVHGTDGTGYDLLTSFGHKLTPIRPALCALLTDERPIGGLAGQRVRARLKLLSKDGRILAKSEGEALFAQDGVSGIAAMQLARFVTPDAILVLDMSQSLLGSQMEACTVGEWIVQRKELKRGCAMFSFFTGAASLPLSKALIHAAGLDLDYPVAGLTDAQEKRIEEAITGFSLRMKGTRGFDAAQVTAGGIATDDFDPHTLESRLQSGLYAAGEVLDVDGDCGGYNLMFAFASGLLAGKACGGASGQK